MAEPKSALDALDASLGELVTGDTPEPDKEPVTETEENAEEGQNAGENAGGEPDKEPVTEGAAEGAAAATDEEEIVVSNKRPDGTFKKKAEIEAEKDEIRAQRTADKAKAAAEGKAPVVKKDDKAAADAKVKDPINDPIPDGLKAPTRERIQTLITMNKESQAAIKEAQAVVEHQQALFDNIASTNATPDQFGNAISYLRAINSDKPEDLELALGFVQAELSALCVKLGRPNVGFSVLAGHKDLVDRVNAGTLTRQDAEELAMVRARTEQTKTTAAAKTTADSTAQQVAAQATQDLDDLGKFLSGIDPQFAAKCAIVTPAVKAMKLPPSQILAAFKKAYAEVKLPPAVAAGAAAAPATGSAQGTRQQPLRAGKQPAGQGAKAATSPMDAMNAALSERYGK